MEFIVYSLNPDNFFSFYLTYLHCFCASYYEQESPLRDQDLPTLLNTAAYHNCFSIWGVELGFNCWQIQIFNGASSK